MSRFEHARSKLEKILTNLLGNTDKFVYVLDYEIQRTHERIWDPSPYHCLANWKRMNQIAKHVNVY